MGRCAAHGAWRETAPPQRRAGMPCARARARAERPRVGGRAGRSQGASGGTDLQEPEEGEGDDEGREDLMRRDERRRQRLAVMLQLAGGGGDADPALAAVSEEDENGEAGEVREDLRGRRWASIAGLSGG